MTEPHGNDLFPSPDTADVDRSTGLLPSQMLREAVALGREIVSPQPIGDDQIQPASIDLRLGEVAYRVRASFLPGAPASVRDKLDLLSMHRIDLTQARCSRRTSSTSWPCSNTWRCGSAPPPRPTRRSR